MYYPPLYPLSPDILQAEKIRKRNRDGQADEEVGTADVGGASKHLGTSSFPPPSALDERSNQRQW